MKNNGEHLRHHCQILIQLSRNAPYVSIFITLCDIGHYDSVTSVIASSSIFQVPFDNAIDDTQCWSCKKFGHKFFKCPRKFKTNLHRSGTKINKHETYSKCSKPSQTGDGSLQVFSREWRLHGFVTPSSQTSAPENARRITQQITDKSVINIYLIPNV